MRSATYYPGLNAIRFYAAFSVIVYHLSRVGPDWGMPPAPRFLPELFEPFFLSGSNGVTFFFILSGFLITSLLLREQQTTGTIRLTAFYRRRAARILPLYAAVAIVGFVVLRGEARPDGAAFPYIAVLLPTIPFLYGWLGALSHLWSIGVEEVFYAVVPLFVKRIGIVKIALIVIIGKFIMEWVAAAGGDQEALRALGYMRFECMAMGALSAWLVARRPQTFRAIRRPIVATLAWLIVVLIIAFPPISTHFGYGYVVSFVFAVILINVIHRPTRLLENRVASTLGKLSYGLYMWHTLIIYGLMSVFRPTTFWHELALYGLTFVLTVIVAALSYRFLEQPFLRLKDRYATPTPAMATGD